MYVVTWVFHSHVRRDGSSNGLLTLFVLVVHEVFVEYFVRVVVVVVVVVVGGGGGSVAAAFVAGDVIRGVVVDVDVADVRFLFQKFAYLCIDLSVGVSVVD